MVLEKCGDLNCILFIKMNDELHPEQIKALRRMTPEQRLRLSLRFIEEMRHMRAVMLREEHPDWRQEQIQRALRDFVSNARS
jgi:hypothetical protein